MTRFLMPLLLLAPLFLADANAGWLDADNVFTIDRDQGDAQLARYFSYQVASIEQGCLKDVESAVEFQQRQHVYRAQLLDMLGLDPLPARTDLEPKITGRSERDGVVVERLHFESSPGLYVTGNLYRPAEASGRLPTVLYVCGHGRVITDGVSYGNKVYYQHHGAWFARHGYVCLLIDSLQLGEIQGIHHGTYRHDRWWWNARGYTPAGVEAWNCHRAIDYLTSRDDVDPERIAVTGRSGGGIYSWWLSATDERVSVAVPVAGITSLWNQVVDGVVEGHCDCMFHVNTQRWDFANIAALVAPRPLLISNSDKDSIFPLSGVIQTHRKVQRVYRAFEADQNLGLQITEGPHKDTQELRIHAFRWINRFLKQDDSLIRIPAEPLFEPDDLRVFHELPSDQINTTIDERFVPMPTAPLPENAASWKRQCGSWKDQLLAKSFQGWAEEAQPKIGEPIHASFVSGGRWLVYGIASEHLVELPLFIWVPKGQTLERASVELTILDDDSWPTFVAQLSQEPPPGARDVQAWMCPRGVGPTAWTDDAKDRIHIRRRFMLLGQTLEGMRVWDVRRGIQSVREICGDAIKLDLKASGSTAGVALYASLFEQGFGDRKKKNMTLDLKRLPTSHHDGPILLNVLRTLDIPQALAIAATNTPVRLDKRAPLITDYTTKVSNRLGWPTDQVRIASDKESNPADDRQND